MEEMILSALFLLILIIDYTQSLYKQVAVEDDVFFTKGNYQLGEAACCYSSTLISELLLDALNYSVKGAGVGVQEAALHAVDGIRSDYM